MIFKLWTHTTICEKGPEIILIHMSKQLIRYALLSINGLDNNLLSLFDYNKQFLWSLKRLIGQDNLHTNTEIIKSSLHYKEP